MRIWVNQVDWLPTQPFLAGTEHFVKQFAEESSKHEKTTVFYDGHNCVHNGVIYCPRSQFYYGDDTLLVVKDPSVLELPNRGRVIYYTNSITDRELLKGRSYEKVLALSNFHKDIFLSGVDRVQVMSHGISIGERKWKKKKNLCLYASSPDRGLSILLREFGRVKQAFPDAELEVAYNGRSDEEMEKLFWEADFWVYPCTGIELYCIAGIRAQAHGCYPIIYPTMALSETVLYGDKVTHDIGEAIIYRMKNRDKVDEIREQMIEKPYPTIQDEYNEVMKVW